MGCCAGRRRCRPPRPLSSALQADDDQLGEVLRDRIARLEQFDPALLRHVRAVDEVDRLLRVTGEDPDQRRDAEDSGVLIGEPAAEFHFHPVRGALAERLGEPAELLAEGYERGKLLHHLRADGGDVDGRGHPAGERRRHLLGGDDSGAILRLGGRGAQMRRHHNVAAVGDRVPSKGSSGKTSRAAPATLPDSRPASRGSRSTSSPRAQLTIRTPSRIFAIDFSLMMPTVSGVFEVKADEVRASEQLVRIVHALRAELTEALGGDELVVGDHPHLEGPRPGGHELSDPPESEYPEGLSVELAALEAAAIPLAAGERCVCLGHVPAEGEHQGEGVLGRRDRVRLGGVRHDDAALGGRLDVDVVDTGPGTADHLEPLGARDQLRRELRGRANQIRRTRRSASRALSVPVDADLDIEVLAEQLHGGVGDLS